MAGKTKDIVVKIQTVTTIPMTIAATGKETLGQRIDQMLIDAERDGDVPNRVVIDLNPKTVNAADVEST